MSQNLDQSSYPLAIDTQTLIDPLFLTQLELQFV